jgi:hypothetical protein
MGINCDSLPFFKGEAIGFGGTFKPKIINKRVNLIFGTGQNELKKNYDSGFKVTCIPPNTPPEEREKLLQHTPSVLGMDILYQFKTCVDRKSVELIYEGQ